MAQTWYDKKEDILSIDIVKGEYYKSIEVRGGILIDIQKDGTVLSIEIAHASKVFGSEQAVLAKATTIM